MAEAIAIPGDTLHNNLIPPDYVKVQVTSVIDDKYRDEALDMPNPDEGIETLEDPLNNFILWYSPNVVLHRPRTWPPQPHHHHPRTTQHLSPLSQNTPPPQQNTMLPPPQSTFPQCEDNIEHEVEMDITAQDKYST